MYPEQTASVGVARSKSTLFIEEASKDISADAKQILL